MSWKPLVLSDDEVRAARKAFASRARFLVDEDLSDLAPILRAMGWEAKSVQELGLSGRDDKDVLAAAQRENRVLLTQDRGFLDDRKFPPHRNPGVVVLPGTEKALVDALDVLLPLVGAFRKLFDGAKIEVHGDGSLSITDQEHRTGRRTTTRYRYTKAGPPEIWENDSGVN